MLYGRWFLIAVEFPYGNMTGDLEMTSIDQYFIITYSTFQFYEDIPKYL